MYVGKSKVDFIHDIWYNFVKIQPKDAMIANNAQRQQPSIPYIALEGNIGAGKSTFLSHFSSHLPVQPVFEPHERWQKMGGGNLLELFYRDPERWAYTFQSCAFITRLQAQEELARSMHAPIQLLERSVFSDRYCFAKNCYEMGMMQELEWRLYTEWFEWLVDVFNLYPTGIIYLRTQPEVSYNRLCKRARSEEAAVPLSYLQQLHEKHESWLMDKHNVLPAMQQVPTLVLDMDEGFVDNKEKQEHFKIEVTRFLRQLGIHQDASQSNKVNEGVSNGNECIRC